MVGLSFYTKDLYLVITQKLTVKSVAVFMKTGSFHEKWQFSLGNLINQLIQDKSFSFIVCLGEAMSDDSMKTDAFHENCCFSRKLALFSENLCFS